MTFITSVILLDKHRIDGAIILEIYSLQLNCKKKKKAVAPKNKCLLYKKVNNGLEASKNMEIL